METDSNGVYVERRLRTWSNEIRGGMAQLGFAKENWLHKALGRSVAVTHIGISEDTAITEAILCEIWKENEDVANVLKAYYLSRGGQDSRIKLAEKLTGKELNRYKFMQLFHVGFDWCREYFCFLAETS